MRSIFRHAAWVTTLIGTASLGAGAAETVSYKDDIQPIIQHRCIECHQPGGKGYEKSGLDLRTYEGIMHGTRYGPVVIPGEPFTSNLIVLIEGRAHASLRMPQPLPKQIQELSNQEKNAFRQWIRDGAKNN